MISFAPIILVFLLFISVMIALSNCLLTSVVYLNLFSIIIAFAYLLFDAPDVAITEAAIGACLTTIFMLICLKKLKERHFEPSINIFKNLFALIICLILAYLLIKAATYFPELQSPNNPIFNDVYLHYTEKSGEEIGIFSIVASILASYRGYDTLGETTVILIAGLLVRFLLKDHTIEKPSIISDTLLKHIASILLPLSLIFALYVQLNGETSPGGGFQAGAIAASSLIAYQLFANNNFNIESHIWHKTSILGIVIYHLTGYICLNGFLDYNSLIFFKKQSIGIFLIELGVGITVLSVMMLIFQIFRERKYVG